MANSLTNGILYENEEFIVKLLETKEEFKQIIDEFLLYCQTED